MIFKKMFSPAVSIIKLVIIFLTQFEIAYSAENYNKYFANEKGIVSIMYHRFNESRYPSTNIQMDIFKKHINIIKNAGYNFLNPSLLPKIFFEEKSENRSLKAVISVGHSKVKSRG